MNSDRSIVATRVEHVVQVNHHVRDPTLRSEEATASVLASNGGQLRHSEQVPHLEGEGERGGD